MHVILKQYLDDFCNSFEYQEYNESDQFELFCNYCVTSRKYLGRVEPRSITTLEDDAGIDGIAFIIDTDDSLKRAKYTTELIGKAKTYLSSDR